jgi:hypothetical protein
MSSIDDVEELLLDQFCMYELEELLLGELTLDSLVGVLEDEDADESLL